MLIRIHANKRKEHVLKGCYGNKYQVPRYEFIISTFHMQPGVEVCASQFVTNYKFISSSIWWIFDINQWRQRDAWNMAKFVATKPTTGYSQETLFVIEGTYTMSCFFHFVILWSFRFRAMKLLYNVQSSRGTWTTCIHPRSTLYYIESKMKDVEYFVGELWLWNMTEEPKKKKVAYTK